jgi:tetratricopeptide (TPR) repeat protein
MDLQPDKTILNEKDRDSKFILRFLDKTISFSLFMLVFGFPLFFTNITLQGLIFEKQLYFYFWLLLALISWVARGVIKEELSVRRTPLDIPILGFWLVYFLSTIFSVDRWHSFWGAFGDPSHGFMSITGLVVAYYLIASNFNEKRLKLLFSAIIGSGSILILWTAILFFNIPFTGYSLISKIPERIAQYIPLSSIGSIGGLGIFFSIMVIFLTVAVLKMVENENGRKIFRKITIGFLLFVLLLDLFLILSISTYVPWIGLFIGVAMFLIYVLSKIVRPHRTWIWLPMVLFIVVMIIRMIGSVSLVKVNLPIEVNPDSFFGGYRVSWDIAKSSFKNKFFLGSGPATYSYDFSLFRPQYFNGTQFYNFRFSQGSGFFFESISTIGGLGIFFLAILGLSYLSICFYLISREKEKNKLYSLGIFSSAIIILTDVFLSKTDGTMFIFAVFLEIFSLVAILLESEAEPKYLALSLKASPKFALALAFVFMVVCAGVAFLFVFLGKIYVADIYAGIAAKEITQNQDDSIVKMDKAINYYGQESAYYTKAGIYYMALANNEALKPADQVNIDKIRQYINYAANAANVGVSMNKNSIETIEALAQIFENSGSYVADSLKLTEDAYKKALELEPHNPDFYLKLGQIKLVDASTQKDNSSKNALFGEAKNYFQKAIDEKNDFAPAYYQLSLVQDALKDTDSAIISETKAVNLTGGKNADYLISLGNMYRLRGKNDDLKSAEAIFKLVTGSDDKNINAHFYLGMTYEKDKNKDAAKGEYQKVIDLLPQQNSDDVKKQLQKMMSNIDKGIENTPENLGLVKTDQASGNQNQGANMSQPATTTATPQATMPAGNTGNSNPVAAPVTGQ